MSKANTSLSRVARGFTLVKRDGGTVQATFDQDGDLWLRSGSMNIYISESDVPNFMRGVSWLEPNLLHTK